MKFKILGVLILVVLSGCATKWTHSSNTENDFYVDRAQCNQEANNNNPVMTPAYDPRLTPLQQSQQSMYNGGAQMGRAFGLAGSFNNCMMAKGYRK